jgi:hypothetical protein
MAYYGMGNQAENLKKASSALALLKKSSYLCIPN